MTEPSNSKVIVEAEGIVKMLGTAPNENKVLKGIDLQLHTGELTLMMGPSGSGKTTLLSVLGCILSPTQGKLSISGMHTQNMNKEQLAKLRRKHVGFVFQSYNLVPTLSAVENVMLALDLRDLNGPDARDQAIDALEAVGLSHRLNAMPSKMSGGEKQRVSIARALAGSPSVILADEPTAALDAKNGMAVMELLATVAQDTRRAVLAVTHDHRTLQYADRIITIDDGRIAGSERPKVSGQTVEMAAH
ncbi:ABC transporter ATP-binding protein [Hyphomicrobium sp.]|jgi:putative ABC transport system ATP-binding protein|uniref:ABC transporter ATP-binding protein n=1 Tax=Hyphomicrobium sp. TaxID=82 RepID=UPI0035626844